MEFQARGSGIARGNGFDGIARLQEGFSKLHLEAYHNLLLCTDLHQ
jgi:hypothetical protein